MSAKSNHTDSIPWREKPKEITAAVRNAEAGVADLQAITNGCGLKRKFTLDGRLVGDIGELFLCADFSVLPKEMPDDHAHDLVAQAGSDRIQLQVILRRATKGGRIEFKYLPIKPEQALGNRPHSE